MPAKLTIDLLYPSTRSPPIRVKRRIKLDGGGRYRDKKSGVDVPLNNALADGNHVWIDAERGVQIAYTGLKDWVGADGRYAYAAQVNKDAQDLQTRGIDFSKYVWPMVIGVLGVMAALVAALAFSVGA